MRYRPLGGTGMPVSELALGTANFGETVDATTARDLVAEALGAGITLFDTADVYAQGRSEEILGAALRSRRDQVVLCTKVGSRVGDTEEDLRASFRTNGLDHLARWRRGIAPTDRGLSRKHLVAAVEASLRRLGTDYIDLLQVHRFDPLTPIGETLRALDDLVRAGKIRAIGCSGWTAWQLYRGLWISDVRGLVRFHSLQLPYNILERDVERDELPACAEAGVAVLAYRVLAGGLLSGRHQDGSDPAPASRMGSRAGYRGRYLNAPMRAGARAVTEQARKRGLTPASLSLAWLLAQPAVTSVLLGISHTAQLDEALAACNSPLPPGEITSVAGTVADAVADGSGTPTPGAPS